MSKDSKILYLILISVAINRACSLLPSHIYFDPFPLYDMMRDGKSIGVNLQYFCYAVTVHVSFILILYAFRLAIPKMARLISFFIVVEFFSLADFFIIYEQSWFSIGFYPVEFTDIKILSYATSILLWKSGNL